MRGKWGNGLTKQEMRAFADRLTNAIGDETMTSFAKRIGVCVSMVSNWTSGSVMPRYGNFIAICEATGKSADYLLGVQK